MAQSKTDKQDQVISWLLEEIKRIKQRINQVERDSVRITFKGTE